MSDSRLLPTGSSPLEVAAAKACAEIEKTPVSIRELWNPDTCPANLLPWLAWAGHLSGKSAAVAGVGVFGRQVG